MSSAQPDAAEGSAKTEVMRRIHDALGRDAHSHDGPVDVPSGVLIPRDYATSLPAGTDVIERFVERVEDYKATVTTTSAGGLAQMVSRALGGAVRIVIPADLDPTATPSGLTILRDGPAEHALSIEDLDGADAVVTAAAVGIAETGTIVLDGGQGQGRRAISLVPDLHVCIVTVDQVVGTVPEAVRLLNPRRPQTWISGPSATSDIELDRVEGVHGPRTLRVILVT